MSSDIRPIRVGIVGLGFGLGFMRDQIARPDGDAGRLLKIAAVCDGNVDRLAAGRKAFGCEGYTDLDELLLRADLEAVTLFSGPVGRGALIERIVRAGKHVMTTKPFELDPEAATRALKVAADQGRVLHLNSPAPVDGQDVLTIRQWQSEFDLGDLVFADWGCWYPSLERADGTWYDDPELCPVAPIFRLGIYGINDLLALDDQPAEVNVMQSRMRTGRPTPDVAQLVIRFRRGAIATIRATWRADPPRGVQEAEFVFERGVVRRRYDTPTEMGARHCVLTLTRGGTIKEGSSSVVEATVPLSVTGNTYRWDMFHQAIRTGPLPNAISPARIVAGVRVIGAMARAAKTGTTVAVDAEPLTPE